MDGIQALAGADGHAADGIFGHHGVDAGAGGDELVKAVRQAAAAAVCAMGLAGEIGWSRMAQGDGNSTYRNRIIDAIYNMDGAALDKGAKYAVR